MQALNRIASLILSSFPFLGAPSIPPSSFFLNWFCINLSGQPGCSLPALLSGKCWDKRIMRLWREPAANRDVCQVTSGNKSTMRRSISRWKKKTCDWSSTLHWLSVFCLWCWRLLGGAEAWHLERECSDVSGCKCSRDFVAKGAFALLNYCMFAQQGVGTNFFF